MKEVKKDENKKKEDCTNGKCIADRGYFENSLDFNMLNLKTGYVPTETLFKF